jgi:hypothetical protein
MLLPFRLRQNFLEWLQMQWQDSLQYVTQPPRRDRGALRMACQRVQSGPSLQHRIYGSVITSYRWQSLVCHHIPVTPGKSQVIFY